MKSLSFATTSTLPTVLAAAFLLALLPDRAQGQAGGIAVNASAPGAAVTLLDGSAADLSAYIGKSPVVLEFWATWCPLCRQLEPALSMARKKYAGRVTFISVGVANNQSAERQKAYATLHGIEGVMVFDGDGNAVKAYGVPHTSYVVAIDGAGKVVFTGVGGEQDIDAAVMRALQAPASIPRGSQR